MTNHEPVSPLAKSLLARHRQGPGKLALVGSFVLHASLIGAAALVAKWPGRERPEDQFKTFRVAIFSPPPQVSGTPEPPVAKPAIAKQPKAPEVTPKKQPPKKAPTTAAAPKPAATAKPKPVAGRNPDKTSPGGEGLNVLQEGEEFPYPEYLENVIRQINFFFRPVGDGNLEAQVGFYIRSDGSVSRLRLHRKSGNIEFDAAALEAVEQAGKRKLFGPLPNDFPRDSLGILFRIVPPK